MIYEFFPRLLFRNKIVFYFYKHFYSQSKIYVKLEIFIIFDRTSYIIHLKLREAFLCYILKYVYRMKIPSKVVVHFTRIFIWMLLNYKSFFISFQTLKCNNILEYTCSTFLKECEYLINLNYLIDTNTINYEKRMIGKFFHK